MITAIVILAISNISLAAYLYYACSEFKRICNRYQDAFRGYDAVIEDYKERIEYRDKIIIDQHHDQLQTINLN